MSAVTTPTPLRVALGSLLLQSLGLAAVAVWLVWLSLTAEETSAGAGIAEAVIALGVGALMAGAAVSMGRGRPGMRGIAVFSQLLYLPLGYFMAQAGLGWYAATAWALGIGTAALLIVPSSRAALGVE
ncbi:hypothetical protein [Stackebrandtia albiflava]|uniref:hypothetical protein n=1 Tax=Stackebrandtia albiflava TaxID=406432 RepID=UPI0011BDFF08|nr:hypothetical protein [Stackebrandtia albiflava]